jgi:DNA-binding response OmpR family regulator
MAIATASTRAGVIFMFGETNSQLKGGLRQALRAEGYLKIREVASAADARAATEIDSPDIAVLDGSLAGDMVALVRDIRHGRAGLNPYIPIILTSWSAEADAIRRMMNSGADEILLKPLSVAALIERVNSMISRRKPYLATNDYVGPDRRGGRVDANAPDVVLIHPPNTFKAKIEGNPISREELADLIRQSQVGMQEQRLTRDLARVGNLSRAIQEAYDSRRRDQKLFSELDQLVFLGRDLKAQIANTPFSQVLPVLDSLFKTATDLRDNLPELDEKKIKLLQPLADAIVAVIGSPQARQHIAEIVSMMKDSRA